MNVLLYSGDGTSRDWLEGTRSTLRLMLGAHYDVVPVTADQLRTAPWPSTTACLVMPGGRDLPYVRDLNGQANERIRAYVEAGGRYLGLCAGAYYASARCEFEVGTPLEVTGDRELAFFPGTARGTAFPGFEYESEAGARNVRLKLDAKDEWRSSWPDAPDQVYACWNGGCWFEDAESHPNVIVLARYAERPAHEAATVLCQVGQGRVLLHGAHPERPLLPASHPSKPAPLADLAAEDARQSIFFASSLALLGLKVSMPSSQSDPPAVQPQFLVAHPSAQELFAGTREALARISESGQIKDSADTFVFDAPATGDARSIVLHDALDDPALADPRFDVTEYLQQLSASSLLGRLVLYSPVVTSTQSLLDRNPKFLACLPDGTVSIASQQVAGRGRGANSWVSPLGCLQFSLVVRVPGTLASKIVFVQYLFGLAVVEAVKSLVPSIPIKLKWPNDLYADLGADQPIGKRYKKLGGILVNSSWAGKDFTLVVGCGLNTLNSAPTTCLRDLAATDAEQSLITLERVLAAIMHRFAELWSQFLTTGSFDPFMQRYLDAWIHGDQVITIEEPHRRVKIVGLTPDFGLLRTEPVDGGLPGFVDLQPDGNTFDMLAGLIRAK